MHMLMTRQTMASQVAALGQQMLQLEKERRLSEIFRPPGHSVDGFSSLDSLDLQLFRMHKSDDPAAVPDQRPPEKPPEGQPDSMQVWCL